MKDLETKRKDSKLFVQHAIDIALIVEHAIEHNKISKKDFAKRIGKNSSEISKWLTGTQNLTLRTLAKIENALDIEIVKDFRRYELGLADVGLQIASNEDQGKVIKHDFVGSLGSSMPQLSEEMFVDNDVIGY